MTATLTPQAADSLRLAWTLHGDLNRLRLPASQVPAFADNLWQHTCFEAFIRPKGEDAYREFNFSPSGQWAAYDFAAYRERRMQPLPDAAPLIRTEIVNPNTLHLHVTLPAVLLPAMPQGGEMSLTAVLEDDAGQCHYWAIRHATDRPDFHHPASFALILARWPV